VRKIASTPDHACVGCAIDLPCGMHAMHVTPIGISKFHDSKSKKDTRVDTLTLALLLFGALAGGFVSGLAGFGTALMALGIWLYALSPSLAVPLVLICSVIAQASTLPSMWKSFDLSLVWPFLIGGLAGVPLGTMMIAQADPQVFKLSIGILLLIFPTALYF